MNKNAVWQELSMGIHMILCEGFSWETALSLRPAYVKALDEKKIDTFVLEEFDLMIDTFREMSKIDFTEKLNLCQEK